MSVDAIAVSLDDESVGEGVDISSLGPRLALIAAIGLSVRLAYVIGVRPHDFVSAPDAFLYHSGANQLAKGQAFIDPLVFHARGVVEPSANHPPAYLIYLAAFSALGFTSVLSHMIASALLGTATIVMVGLVGSKIGGARVGLVAAMVAAVYPPLVAIDGAVQSESMAVLVVTTLVYAVMRYPTQPTVVAAAGLGALTGLSGMTRPEQLLVGLVVVPPLIIRTGATWRDRVVRLGAATCVCLAIVLPWLAFNMTRFEEPVYFSTNLDFTLAATNCDDTWHGSRIGYWSWSCTLDALKVDWGPDGGDQSQRALEFRRAGFSYLGDHWTRLPVVMTARVLRLLNVWDPLGQIRIDDEVEGREYWMAAASVSGFYVLAAFALAGARHLHQEGRLRAELVWPPLIAVLVAALFMGNTRYRSPSEGVLCVLAAVGLDLVIRHTSHLRVARNA